MKIKIMAVRSSARLCFRLLHDIILILKIVKKAISLSLFCLLHYGINLLVITLQPKESSIQPDFVCFFKGMTSFHSFLKHQTQFSGKVHNVNKNQLRTPMQFPVQFLKICLIVKVNMKPSLYSHLILIFFNKEY